MNYTTGLTYKPMSKGTKDLLAQGALVHMFEFRAETSIVYMKDFSGGRPDYFMNFVNALSGKNTGDYSMYRKQAFFNEEQNYLEVLPCSGIKTGFPMELYNSSNNVGILIDPKKAKLLIIQTNDCYSVIERDGSLSVNHLNIFNDKTLEKANFGDGYSIRSPHTFKDGMLESSNLSIEWPKDSYKVNIPLIRPEEKYQELQDIFSSHLWNMYSGSKNPGEAGFRKNIKAAIRKSQERPGNTMMTEIIAHVPPEAVSGIIIYSNHIDNYMKYDDNGQSDNGQYHLKGITLANLLRETMRQKNGIELPVLNYHSNLKIDNRMNQGSGFEFAEPSIREVKIENKKIAAILEARPPIRALYEHHLGKAHVQDMILGRAESFTNDILGA